MFLITALPLSDVHQEKITLNYSALPAYFWPTHIINVNLVSPTPPLKFSIESYNIKRKRKMATN